MTERWLSSGEFAAQVGVTVRTLRYYDRLGLLTPKARNSNGHRRYATEELVRLQQILTLKFLGYPLLEIGEIIESPDFNLQQSLQRQQQQLEQQISKLKEVVVALEHAQASLTPGLVNWEHFVSIIKVVQMEQQREEWLKKYYTEEQLAELRARPFSTQDQERVSTEWAAVYAEVKQLADAEADPAGPQAQALAARYQGLIDQFTGGNAGIAASLQRMYAEPEKMPADTRWEMDEKSSHFIGAMLAVYHAQQNT